MSKSAACLVTDKFPKEQRKEGKEVRLSRNSVLEFKEP